MRNEITRHKLVSFARWMGTLCMALLLLIACCEIAGWPFLRKPLQQFLENTLERNVQIERPFRLQLLGGIRLQVGELKLSAPEGFELPYLVDAQGLDLTLRYRDLWPLKDGQAYRIQSLRADHLDAHLVRRADGRASWEFALEDTSPPRPFPLIEVLAVNQGQAQLTDAVTSAQLTITFFTEEGTHLATPESSVKFQGQFRQIPLQGALVTQGFLPVATQSAHAVPINSKGWLKYGAVQAQFQGAVYDLFGTQRIKGKVNVTGPSLASVGDLLDLAFPRTPAFNISAEVEKGVGQWQVNVPAARIGRSRLTGQFTYVSAEPGVTEKPVLRGKLRGALLVLADLAPAFGAADTGVKVPHEKASPDKVFPDTPLDFGTYDRMNAEIDVHLETVELGNAFRQPISPLQMHVSLLDNKLSLIDLDARTAQGSVAGTLTIDAHEPGPTQEAPPTPDWALQLAVRDILIERWLKVTPASQPSASKPSANTQPDKSAPASTPPAYISGRLTGKAALTGHGRSTAELLRSLDGQLAMIIREGEISHLVVEAAGLDIAQSIGLLIKGDQPLPMQCAAMGWRAKQGVLSPEAALIDTPVTTVLVSGNVDVGRELLNLKLQASPKNFSPFTVRSPIRITGPFVDPSVSVSPGPIAARVAGGVLLALINPFAAILPFLDPGGSHDASAGSANGRAGCEQTLMRLKAKTR